MISSKIRTILTSDVIISPKDYCKLVIDIFSWYSDGQAV